MSWAMRSRAAGAAGLVTLLAGAGAMLAAAPAAGGQAADPPGNNGTVKIDDVPFDDYPDNEPHVGCVFQVDFYGYDEGDLSATVLFEAIPPTADESADGQDLLTDELDIGEDEAGGGTDLDASGTYDLSEALAGIDPHSQQGWHVKLTVHAEGSQGADVKHKVFWVEECAPEVTTTTTAPSGPTTTKPHGPTTSVPSTSPSTSPSTTPSGPPTSVETPETTVPGVSPTAPASTTTTTQEVSGALPKTGTSTVPMVAAGVGLMSLGGILLAAIRLRRAA
jgi:LPXTG-motif cell wall-anchored protein